ncbi:unnamed protein product [Peniophora sp. CBMAI 1063]|nr:unnamed protein product [Peniophora sp. CBMAI 1063]
MEPETCARLSDERERRAIFNSCVGWLYGEGRSGARGHVEAFLSAPVRAPRSAIALAPRRANLSTCSCRSLRRLSDACRVRCILANANDRRGTAVLSGLSMLRRAGRGCKHLARNISANNTALNLAPQTCPPPHLRKHAIAPKAGVQVETQEQTTSHTGPAPGASGTPNRIRAKDFTRMLARPPEPFLDFLEEPFEGLSSLKLLKRVPRILKTPQGRIRPEAVFKNSRQLVDMCEKLLDTQKPSLALRALSIARHIGEAQLNDRRVWERIAHAIASRNLWALMPDLLALARSSMGTPTVRLLNWWTRSLLEASDYATLRTVPRIFAQESRRPDRTTYHLMLSGFLRNRDLAAAMHILELIRLEGMSVDAKTQAVIASSYRSLGPDVDVRHQALQALRSGSASTSTTILNALLQLSVDNEDGEWIGIILELLGLDHIDIYRQVNPTGSSFLPDEDDFQDEDITLSAQTIEAVTTFRITRTSLRVAPDVASYTILMNFAAARKDLDSFISLFAHMQGQGIQPDNILLCSLLRVLFAVDRPIAALRVAADIYGESPTAKEILHSLAEDIPGHESEEFPFIDAKPSVAVLNTLASGLYRSLGLSGFDRVLQVMHACDLSPDEQTVEVLAARLFADENADPDIILATIRRLISSSSAATLRHCDVLLQAVVRRAKRATGLSAWIPKTTRAHHGALSERQNVNMAITATGDALEGPTAGLTLANPAEYAMFKPIQDALADRGIRADRSMLALRLQYEGVRQNMSTAKAIFQSMLDHGLYPTAHHYASLMDGYASVHDVENAIKVMEAAEEAGIAPNEVMYTILITAYARMGEPELATRTMTEMIERGIRPDVPAIDAAVSAYAYLGLWHSARRALLGLWPQDLPAPVNPDKKTVVKLMRELHALRKGRQASSRKFTQPQRAHLIGHLRGIIKRMLSEAKQSKKGSPARAVLKEQ